MQPGASYGAFFDCSPEDVGRELCLHPPIVVIEWNLDVRDLFLFGAKVFYHHLKPHPATWFCVCLTGHLPSA
jgi:hypothetical protein